MTALCKKLILGSVGTFAVLVTVVSQANEHDQNAQEQSNLKKALYCMDILENRSDLKAAQKIDILREECFSQNYIQHSPHVADGQEAVLRLFENRFKNHPETSISIKRTASEGDLVWIHLHAKRTPQDLGRAVINIFRMENGKFVEHWNTVQAVPEKSKNNNTMF